MATQSKILPELLAPAGDNEALRAALAAGADAIYLGGKLFNARRNAKNFEPDELAEAAKLLHLHHKKLYVTVNTLIMDQELSTALDYLAELYQLGVDAVILQDLGLANLARRYLPELELHASTQMTVHNRAGVEFLKDLGIKRVVLARELTRAEVAEIATLGVELEVFVHGALCIGYSGQCLLSSLIGGRSGNRGKCAQPCRLEYQLVNQRGETLSTVGNYLLSPKDQALAGLLPELVQSGVASLKIEGRMKRPEYVYTVVKVYRQLLDKYASDPDNYRVATSELQELEESFNRGFTTGYFGGNRNEQIIGMKRPNNRGVYLGRVQSITPGKLELKLEAPLAVGDQLEGWVTHGGRSAGVVHAITRQGEAVTAAAAGESVGVTVAVQANKGDRLFKVFSSRLQAELQSVLSAENDLLKIPCRAKVSGALDRPLEVSFRDAVGNIGSATTAANLQLARNRPLTTEVLVEQLGRLGNTFFKLIELQNELPDGLMMPLSELNQARRAALEALLQARLNRPTLTPVQLPKLHYNQEIKKSTWQKNKLSVWVSDLDSVAAVANAGVQLIYVGGEELTGFHWENKSYQQAIELAHAAGVKLVLALPRINRAAETKLQVELVEAIQVARPDGILISELGSLALAQTTKLPIYLNYPMNIFNHAAVEFWQNFGVQQLALSPELSLTQLTALGEQHPQVNLEVLLHGGLELMISEYCPLGSLHNSQQGCSQPCRTERYALRDRLGLDFPIYLDQFCRMHLYNSKELCLYGELEKLRPISTMTWRLELRTVAAQKAATIVRYYRELIQQLQTGKTPPRREELIQELKVIMGREITKGHYFRGVE